MVLRLTQPPVVDDPRGHSAETVSRLRALLASGAVAHADPQRKNFFELEDDSRVYYIYVYPHGGKVLLLATWPKEAPAEPGYDRAAAD